MYDDLKTGKSVGKYVVRHAQSADDLAVCQALRHRCFFGQDGCDEDNYDALSQHIMVQQTHDDRLIATFRYMISSGGAICDGYAADYYDLAPLAALNQPMMEIGRFCCDPQVPDPQVMRMAWGAITRLVDRSDVQMLFGCTSFAGTDPGIYTAAFQQLSRDNLSPYNLSPKTQAHQQVSLNTRRVPKGSQSPMPALLKAYLAMGGSVSDCAVIDPCMGTLHVLTFLEIGAIPVARAKALRALGAAVDL